jgi:hypothetical protein
MIPWSAVAPTARTRAFRVEVFTVGWNADAVASSVALIGFGLDSVIEVSAALIVIWQFNGVAEDREQRASYRARLE